MQTPLTLQTLEPNDGTRYRVVYGLVEDPAENYTTKLFFGFGLNDGRELIAFPFRLDTVPAHSYFAKKLHGGWPKWHTDVAGYAALLFLYGNTRNVVECGLRSAFGDKQGDLVSWMQRAPDPWPVTALELRNVSNSIVERWDVKYFNQFAGTVYQEKAGQDQWGYVLGCGNIPKQETGFPSRNQAIQALCRTWRQHYGNL